MKENFTELVFILDKSGSMQSLADDTVGGFNSLIEKQRGIEGGCAVSTVLFDSRSTVLHDRVPLSEVKPMTRGDYVPSGNTALIDAIGGAVKHIGNVHKYARSEDIPEHTMFVIITDGMENASRGYAADKVRAMIERQKERYGWEFIFIGANIDAVETAKEFGISEDRAVDYLADAEGTAVAYAATCGAIKEMRCGKTLSDKWREKIDRDLKNRKKF